MSEVVDDDTLKMLVKLTSETKLLYKDLESTPKMRRARRLLYLAQLGLMAEKTFDGDHVAGSRMPVSMLVPSETEERVGSCSEEPPMPPPTPEQDKPALRPSLSKDNSLREPIDVPGAMTNLNQAPASTTGEQIESAVMAGTTREATSDKPRLNRRRTGFKVGL